MSSTLLEGHVLDVLAGLPAGHFHTVVTSPPYWQLRNYSTPPQTWPDGWVGELGQEPTPELFVAHLVAVFEGVKRVLRDDGTLWVNLAGSYWSEPGGQNGGSRPSKNGQGASTLYADTARSGHGHKAKALHAISAKAIEANRENGRQKRAQHPVYKPLDWVDVPGLFARAMQAAGWLWRSDVVWVKPSALPESISGTRWEKCKGAKVALGRRYEPGDAGRAYYDPTRGYVHQPQGETLNNPEARTRWADCPGCPKCSDTQGLVLRRGSGRPTKATERVLLFSKRQGYFFDQEAVREGISESSIERWGGPPPRIASHDPSVSAAAQSIRGEFALGVHPNGRNLRDWWVIGPEPQGSERIVKRVPVSADEAGHDTVRTASPDCPVHGRPQSSSRGRGGRSGSPSSRTPGSGARPAQGLFDAPPATPPPSSTDVPYSAAPDPGGSPAANGRSMPDYRTAPAPATTGAGTPSVGTAPRTGDTSASPVAAGPHPGTPESSTSPDQGGPGPQSPDRTAGTGLSATGALSAGDIRGSHTGESSTSVGSDPGGLSPSGQTPPRSADTSTSPACTCSYYKEIVQETAHYSAYPSALPERCIKAGTSEWGCCPACGAPWARVIDRKLSEVTRKSYAGAIEGAVPVHRGSVDRPGGYEFGESTTLGWRPTCRCDAGPPVPARCLDIFGGSGTTALAANRLGRDCTLVELKPAYAALARKRVGREPLSLFATHGDGEAAGE